MKTLRLILGDQLNSEHSWFKEKNEKVTYCMFELRQETDYVHHHIQKIVGFFLAMRTFRDTLISQGHEVIYFELDHPNNSQSLTDNIHNLIETHLFELFEYLLPDEFRLNKQLEDFAKQLNIKTSTVDSEHFLTHRFELRDFFKGKKSLLMESFYRYMRKKHQILMNQGNPEGGKWNYDKSNQKKWKNQTLIPPQKLFSKNVTYLVNLIQEADIKTIGEIPVNEFSFPVTRQEALIQLEYFCDKLLIHFGDFQDAMHTEEHMLYHSGLSFALNLKLISPQEVFKKVEAYYSANSDKIHISQVEGFIRQIIGWREYMRGVYWKEMPAYEKLNKLNNTHSLPDFYWSGKTRMTCLKTSISSSLKNAYAHHIQRLMITGNFALLTQTNPDEVDQWYLGIYLDAIQWVQLPNTRGMSQWADGGTVATKPYVSSASYIHKMSNYCTHCAYDHKKRTGNNACPFNSLYWNFLDEKKEYFKNNQRMSMMLNLLSKIPAEELTQIKQRASMIIENPDAF